MNTSILKPTSKPQSTNSKRLEVLILYRDKILSDMIEFSNYELLWTVLSDRYDTIDKWIIELRKEIENE